MELLVIILIVIFITANGKNKKKGATPGRGSSPARGSSPNKAAPEIKVATRARFPKRDQVAEMLSRWVDDALEETEAANAQAKAPAAVKSVKVEGQKSPVFMAASAAATIPRETGDIPARQPSMLEADEEGCVGGSMAHTHEEGESRKEHARHVREARKQEVQEALAVQAATELSEMNLHRLRQAVVMAEILDRPRALRRAR